MIGENIRNRSPDDCALSREKLTKTSYILMKKKGPEGPSEFIACATKEKRKQERRTM
tara:strand:- start:284 stop:454 length:171 start_codon:yes stop_codon:yes gene_type:complete